MVEVSLATMGDWQAILPMVSAPQGDAWGLAARYPQGLRAALPSERQHLAVVRHQDRIIACGLRSVRRVRYGDRLSYIGYLTQLRRDPTSSTRLAHAGLRAAFDCLAATRRGDELPYDFTSILTGNNRARRLLEAGLAGVPTYHYRATYRTRVWSARTLASKVDPRVVAGRVDEPYHQGLALQPLVDEDAPLHLLGTSAWGDLHDPIRARQTVVTVLPSVFSWLKPVINAMRWMQGLPGLPKIGRSLPLLELNNWGWRPGAAIAAIAVAGWLAQRTAPNALIVGGWCDDHPDAAALAAHTPPAEIISARWYTVGGTLPPGPWHWETGCL